MSVKNLVEMIDEEIGRLEAAKKVLVTATVGNHQLSKTDKVTRRKRRLSASARKRIGEAQRARWAKQKKAA